MAHQLTITVEDDNVLAAIKNLLGFMKGVTIKAPQLTKKKSSYERAMDDVENGRVVTYTSTEEMFADLGI